MWPNKVHTTPDFVDTQPQESHRDDENQETIVSMSDVYIIISSHLQRQEEKGKYG